MLKCAIVEDSSLHRILLEKMIGQFSQLDLIDSYTCGEDALKGLKGKKIDLIFVDIEMPGIDGFELMEKLDQHIQIIITSANAVHATRAFDFNVTDYLLKPYTSERFNKALQKVFTKNNLMIKSAQTDNTLMVRSNLKEVKLHLNEILWVEALGDYVKIVTKRKNIVVLSSMKSFMEKLPKERFLRIHKSYIVNIEKIELYDHSHVQIANKKLPLSRNNNQQLDEILNFLN